MKLCIQPRLIRAQVLGNAIWGVKKDAKVDDFIKDVLRLSPYHYDLFCEILKVFGKILMVKQELTHQNFLTSTSLSILDSDGSNPKT